MTLLSISLARLAPGWLVLRWYGHNIFRNSLIIETQLLSYTLTVNRANKRIEAQGYSFLNFHPPHHQFSYVPRVYSNSSEIVTAI